MEPIFSFISTCFHRSAHLLAQADWLHARWNASASNKCWEHIVVCDSMARDQLNSTDLGYRPTMYVQPYEAPFPKARLLNLAATKASGRYLVPMDVDLLPLFETEFLLRNQELFNNCVFSGYRLNCSQEALPLGKSISKREVETCPEDGSSALKTQLLAKERFGVGPIVGREVFLKTGGYDEQFRGWGAEDQDLIERVCIHQGPLVRSPDYVWLHMDHGVSAGWNDHFLIDRNRERYAKVRAERAAAVMDHLV